MPASLGEIASRLDDVFRRFEALANDLPKTFINKELFAAYKDLIDAKDAANDLKVQGLERRIEDLEDDKKWLYRLIISAVILAVLGVIIGVGALNSVTTTPKALTMFVVR